MADVQLKLVKKTNDGVFGKAINNFNKILYSPSSSFFNIAINSKRNTVVKNFLLSESYEKNVNEKKKNHFMSKYEKNYETYLGMLENYITDTVYNKVKKEVSSLKENQLLSSYYELIALKSTDFVEYKYRRQTLLLAMDWDNVISNKSNAFVEKYKKFYLSVCEQLYKALMRHYAINLTDATKDKAQTYAHIYNLIEDYIKVILPFQEETETNKRIIEVYKNQIMTIDTYNKKSYSEIKRSMLLLELSKFMFAYSLPMVALDQCYVELIEAAMDEKLSETKVLWKDEVCINVVLASGGYPGKFNKGYEIKIDDSIKDKVFLAGAKFEDGVLKTSGGRVLSVIGRGKTLEEAREEAYKNVKLVNFKDSYCRTDIGIYK